MAEQKQKKKSSAAKSAARGGSKSSARGKGGKKAAARPVRREIGAFVCLFLGIFTVLCCFHVNAVVLNLMASLFKGTIGAGFYILPFSFLLGFLILLLHDGRPVALRVTCAVLLAATIGALAHVFSGGSDCVHTLFFAVAIPGLLLVAYTEQWCLQDIDMVPLDQVREKLEEEGDQQ